MINDSKFMSNILSTSSMFFFKKINLELVDLVDPINNQNLYE
jgi:hypothetical protein